MVLELITQNWLLLAIISSVFASFAMVFKKRGLNRAHTAQFMSTFKLMETLTMVPFLFLFDFSFSWQVWVLFVVTAFIGIVALLIGHKGIKHLDFGVSVPLFNLTPVFVLGFAFVFLGERLSNIQLGGIGLLMLGTYVLGGGHERKDVFAPLRELFQSKYVLLILLSVVMSSFTSILEKRLISFANVFTYLFLLYALGFLFSFAYSILRFNGVRDVVYVFHHDGKFIIGNAVCSLVANLSYAQALSLAMVSLVNPIKRFSSVIDVVLSRELFHEKHFKYRFAACVIMFVGVVLVTG